MKKTRANFRARLMGGAAGAVLMICAGSAAAQEVAKFDIAPQSLADALKQFGYQSGHDVLASPALADSKVTRGVNGEQSVELALNQLLEGSGLTWKRNGDTFLIVSASDPQSGSAAGDGAEGTVQALVVTAQKREENIQDVPIAMSAFTQEDLTRSQVAGGPDLMTQVPNFTFTKTNFTSYSIQIRGIGTQAISATTDPAVAVAFNNTPFLRSHFFEQEFYDLARVEVLRGPQGTLYGRNATAGVVNVISAKPAFHFESKLSADLGNYNSTRFEGMLNMPLVEDKAALRIAGAWTKRDGYDTNQLTGHPIDGRDLWSTRVSLRIDPTERLRTNFVWEHFKEDDDRLRSGKQLCKRDQAPMEVDGVPVALGDTHAGGGVMYAERYLDQGCVPTSFWSPEAFQVPDGKTLPYVLPLGQVGAPIQAGWESHFDVYASTTQSHDLRVIESQVDPRYRANSDTLEYNIDFDVTPSLTLTSQTGFNHDFLWSIEDYNRFNTQPGAFEYCDPARGSFECWTNANGQVFEDPSRGGYYNYGAGEDLVGKPCDLTVGDISCKPDVVFCDPQIGCSDRVVVEDLSEERSRQFSQEFRLASNFEGPFNFSVGANYMRYKTEENYLVFFNTITLTAAGYGFVYGSRTPWVPGVSDNHECLKNGFDYVTPAAPHNPQWNTCAYIDPNPIESINHQGHNYFLSQNPYKLTSYAAFGEAYYNLTPVLKLTAGLRWTVDKKHFVDIPSELLVAGYGYPVTGEVKQHWSEPTGRLVIDWTPTLGFTDQTLVYASYTHGYKAGGANPPGAVLLNNRGSDINVPVHPLTFNPEYVNAYEVGTKNTLLGGRLTFNLNGFYYDYTGYQISEIVDRSAINMNFDAKIWGVELESDWRPLENLRLGLKVGYEDTRIADGMKAVDLMDRTAAHTDWMVVKPFITQSSNCILPKYVIAQLLYQQAQTGGVGYQNVSVACGHAYSGGIDPWSGYANTDPVTGLPYQPDPQGTWDGAPLMGQYPGFNPATAPNNGAGFDKDLSGNSLPNAPHWTTTLTADYTLPIPNDWLITLHGDFYQQSEAWARVFNMPGYDKLKAYNNVNLAAIFSNEDRGWTVMAYVKNVFDKDNITGAFLNSDDTGLTTNVFLNEPRLYGLRVTKNWTESQWWSAHANHSGYYPFRLELEGYAGDVDHGHEFFRSSYAELFGPDLAFPFGTQNALETSYGGGVKFTYAPSARGWFVRAGARYGRAGGHDAAHAAQQLPEYCVKFFSNKFCGSPSTPNLINTGFHNYFETTTSNDESHAFADFEIGREVGLGALTSRLTKSSLVGGIGYGRFDSDSRAIMHGNPDWYVPPYALIFGYDGFHKYPSHRHQFSDDLRAGREFEGAGPEAAWEGAVRLAGSEGPKGEVDLDLGLGGVVLFGKQTTHIQGVLTGAYLGGPAAYMTDLIPPYTTPVNITRSKSVTVPGVRANLGLSYSVGDVKVSGGYRMERYFKAIDGGYQERKTYDRTFDGPYFKVSVGFGG